MALALIEKTHSINPEASLYIKTSTKNVACKRVIEKCGGILCGYEDSSFTRSMDSLRKECDEHGFPFLDMYEKEKRLEILDMIEKGRDGVCIYSIS